ncbi:MAG: ABC transporter permease [Pseudomonadota bacterium]
MDGLQEILYTLKQNKLRTVLTAFGVFWGIFMLILLLGAGKGMQNGVYKSFGSEVMDFVVIWSETTSVAHNGLGLGRKVSLKITDIEAIKQKIPEVRFIASDFGTNGVTIKYENKTGNYSVHGIPDEYFKIKEDIPFTFGRKTNPFDDQEVRKVAAVGSVVAERIFGKDVNPVGKTIRINDVAMRVIGVFHDKGNRGQDSERIYIPKTIHAKLFGNSEAAGAIWVRPNAGVDGFELEKKVIALLKIRHDVSPEDKRAIKSFNMAEPAKMVNGLFIAINIFIWFVGLGTLTAGIIGVSNIMIITVKERTREIGIRKALGATPFGIVSTLLMESILVTSIAGYFGLVLGVGLLELVSFGLRSAGANLEFFDNPEVNFQVAITSIILLVIVGALAGLMPALKAARIMPIEAMRAE